MSFCSGPEDYCFCGEEFNVTLEDEVDDVENNGVHVFGFWMMESGGT
jgi:hypothetical protein